MVAGPFNTGKNTNGISNVIAALFGKSEELQFAA
jgi:hypothetical protein